LVSPLDPAVLTVTQIHSGTAWNVSPEIATISGTARWFTDRVGEKLHLHLNNIVEHVARAWGCTAEVRFNHRYPATLNDPDMAQIIRRAAKTANIHHVQCAPSMASEDFAFLLKERPGAYIWLGSQRDGANPGLHSSQFDFNDALVPIGANLWTSLIAELA
jgi:hippurate hydrolase